MNRGADRQDIYLADDDYRLFESSLGDATSRYEVEVHSYCLMTNHFHLLLHCPNAGLSEAMHLLESGYARWFNGRYERDGPVFRGRFHSVAVDSSAQLIQLSRYIHRNPLSFVPASALAQYRWSSLGPFLGIRAASSWLVLDDVLGLFGDDVQRLRTHVETEQPADRSPPTGFHSHVVTTGDEVDSAIAHEAEVDVATLYGGHRGVRNGARILAVTLLIELRIAEPTAAAARYGMASAQTARNVARQGRALTSSDASCRRLRTRVLERLGYT